jgi:hypothetical protein
VSGVIDPVGLVKTPWLPRKVCPMKVLLEFENVNVFE